MSKLPSSDVIVVDDHPLFRRGIVDLLNRSEAFNVIADFSSATSLNAFLESSSPHLLLLDLQMPDMSGLDALKQIKPQYKNLKIVILTASDESEQLLETIRHGADGYLMKDSEPEYILKSLQSILEGRITINETAVDILAQSLRNTSKTSATHSRATIENHSIDSMTERERQTLELIARGMNNKLIARELGISDGTVKVYVKNLLRKLNLHSRLELAAWAHSHSPSNN
ncbi:response regulator [Marinomonas colpomeniae]|uniref:Response regulator n=1 Tax=Marinomonas colpomeniae TaxID=2774408 RepID=A0ABR8P5E9_9GAMM|nr:response regulator [Marinomonas colpomeniae]MBD5772552.1 response regulator [Marinomonas colpomeniae]